MTTLNPTHFPSSSANERRGQAIYKRDVGGESSEEYDESGYPKSVKKLDRDARREARQRIKRVQPAIPDLRCVIMLLVHCDIVADPSYALYYQI
jgi:hypothetical protein